MFQNVEAVKDESIKLNLNNVDLDKLVKIEFSGIAFTNTAMTSSSAFLICGKVAVIISGESPSVFVSI